jgi:ABC-type sugar transport system substrate-binding protein
VALTATENTLQAHPDLSAIYSPWNIGLQGVFSVLEKEGKLKKVGEPGHITIVTIDGAPLGCKSVRDGTADLDLATPLPEMAKRAVAAAIKAAKGGTVDPKVEFLPGVPYMPADVGTRGQEIWGCS